MLVYSHAEGVKLSVLLRGIYLTMEMKQRAATNGIDQDQEHGSRIPKVRPVISTLFFLLLPFSSSLPSLPSPLPSELLPLLAHSPPAPLLLSNSSTTCSSPLLSSPIPPPLPQTAFSTTTTSTTTDDDDNDSAAVVVVVVVV